MLKYILKSFWSILSVLLVALAIFGGAFGVFYVLSMCTVTQVCWIMGGLGLALMIFCAIMDGRARYLRENTELKAKQVDVLDKCYLDVCHAVIGKKTVDSDINIATATMINELHRYGRTFGWDDTFRSYVDRLKNTVEPLGLSV